MIYEITKTFTKPHWQFTKFSVYSNYKLTELRKLRGVGMFKNLKAEMARNGITNQNIAEVLDINVCTVSAKLNTYDRLKFSEAKKIQQELFPNCSVDYLFDTTPKR